MALTPREVELVDRLKRQHDATQVNDELMLRYYQARQRVEQLGLAIPPNLRKFMVIANWCRTVVDTKADRQQVRALILPGEETADPLLRSIWDASNLSAHFRMFNQDRMIYGRAFLSVGANESNRELPFVRVESPREMSAIVDVRREEMVAAARFYGTVEGVMGPTNVTLYLPNETVWVERSRVSGRWAEVDRDVHNLGRVPVVMHLNRRLSGAWAGESEMTDIMPITDSAARSLTNMQFAQDSHGAPRMWMSGVARGDFTKEDGSLVPQIEAYFNAITMLKDPQARVGQLEAADLKNFETAMQVYGRQASVVTGFPARYFGLTSVNPPSEGSIVADESTLIRSCEADNEQTGMTLGWVGALAYRFATGEDVEGNRVRTDYFDPATPTRAQMTDALVKLRQVGAISREGMWDEWGWSEGRKAKERSYLAAEQAAGLDPYLAAQADGQRSDAPAFG